MNHSASNIRTIGLFTATAIVVANMIGTGVFTSLGFQVLHLRSAFPLLMLWVVGGIIALCGALTYGELGAALPRSGGEYHLLTKIYHPALGFLSGWISVTVGFAAPAALAAIALSTYLQALFPGLPVQHVAAAVVVLFTIVHSVSLKVGSYSHNFFTIFKVLLILVFVAAGYGLEQAQSISLAPRSGDLGLMPTPGFAVSLIYVSFAYAGWNAAIYVAGELKRPQQNLPKALFLGTLLVLVLYFFLNYIFLYTVPMAELSGRIQIGYLSGARIFGETGGQIMAAIIAFLLVSTVSGHVFVGPRITQVMGEDYRALRILGKRAENGLPVNSFLFQLIIMLMLIYTSSFEQVMVYAGFTLNLVTTLTVAGVFVLRARAPHLPRPYKTWGYPFTPILFLVMSVWTLAFVMVDKPRESAIGLALVVLGLGVYFIDRRIARPSMATRAQSTVESVDG
ncbi:MAG: amino acid permease [bacterium]